MRGMLKRAVLFGVKITVRFWLQGRNSNSFRTGLAQGTCTDVKGGEVWLAASLLLVLMHEPDWISQSKTGSRGWQ